MYHRAKSEHTSVIELMPCRVFVNFQTALFAPLEKFAIIVIHNFIIAFVVSLLGEFKGLLYNVHLNKMRFGSS